MAYNPSPNCMAIAAKAAGGDLTNADILEAFDEVNRYKAELEAQGNLTGNAERIRKFAAEKAEAAKIKAASDRRSAALNIIVRKNIDAHVKSLVDQGMTPPQAMLAFLRGAGGRFVGAKGGRKSVWAMQMGGRNRFQKRWLKEALAERPHLRPLIASRDKAFDRDVTIEMWELREGGSPGKTGNDDAKWFAAHTAKYLELARTEVNRAGNAGIGKLDGYAGVQSHNDIRMIRAGKDVWIGRFAARLDKKRSFPEGVSDIEMQQILGDTYDTIITGLPNAPTATEMGQRVSPSNMAKSLAKHRVYHFKSAEDAMAYNAEFGYGGTIQSIASQLARMGNVLGTVEALGSNPEVMFKSVVADQARKVKEDPTLDPKTKAKWTSQLSTTEGGKLKGALDIATGLANKPDNIKMATIGQNVRAVQRGADLGGATLTSLPMDMVVGAMAAQFRGGSFLKSWTSLLSSMTRGLTRTEQAQKLYLASEGMDGLIGQMLGGQVANDATTGWISAGQDLFFRLNGLTGTTDIARASNERMIAAEMGMYSNRSYGELKPNYRDVLGMHGIDEARWDVLRQASVTQINGQPYITGDSVRDMPDEAFAPLVQDRLDAIAGRRDYAERATAILRDAKRKLELDVYAFFADEVSYGVVTPDAATEYWTTGGGKRSGTQAGELFRMIWQYKGTPVAFIQRPLARAVHGRAWTNPLKDPTKYTHLGTGIVALMIAGYMSMTLKDALRGYWPPRDPKDPRTLTAALLQSGALGLYGDYIFSQVNRFGGSPLESASGPSIGTLSDLLSIGMDARDFAMSGGEDGFSAARALSWTAGNIPFANLFYVKPALDYVLMDSLREYLSPGYQRRQERDRIRQYVQERMDFLPPRTLAQTLDQ